MPDPENHSRRQPSEAHLESLLATWSMLKYSQLIEGLCLRDRHEVELHFDELIDSDDHVKVFVLDEEFTFIAENAQGIPAIHQSDDFLIETNAWFNTWLYEVRAQWRMQSVQQRPAVVSGLEEDDTLFQQDQQASGPLASHKGV